MEKKIQTPIDLLRWDYYQYVINHPIAKWNVPTSILYGGKDNLQSREIIQEFAGCHDCKVTISEGSEHAFMQTEDVEIVSRWLEANI